MRRTLLGRKLLVASIGVASVSYTACGAQDAGVVGNCCPGMDAAVAEDEDVGSIVGNFDSSFNAPDASDAEPPDAADAGKIDAAGDGSPGDAGDAAQVDAAEDAPSDAAEGG
ncbi:MAG: hypothetical protein ACLQVI_11745 [Polyangiaceae bacterium]